MTPGQVEFARNSLSAMRPITCGVPGPCCSRISELAPDTHLLDGSPLLNSLITNSDYKSARLVLAVPLRHPRLKAPMGNLQSKHGGSQQGHLRQGKGQRAAWHVQLIRDVAAHGTKTKAGISQDLHKASTGWIETSRSCAIKFGPNGAHGCDGNP